MTREEYLRAKEKFIQKWGASMGNGFTDEELSADLDELLSLQPAEGAEDDHSEDIALMAEFAATLHAQRLADKMVEESLIPQMNT